MCNVYFNFSLLFQSSCPCQTAGIDIKACFWEFLAGISLLASTGECFEFASLQLPRFLAFLPLISFCYREDQGYPSLKLSTRTMGILVCLGNDFFLWKFDWVYRRWNVFFVNRWHLNRIYTINQGTEKRRDTELKLSTQTMGILVCLETDFLVAIRRGV